MKLHDSALLYGVFVDGEGCLHLDPPFLPVVPALRYLSDLADVLMAEGAEAGQGIAYRMYRGVYCEDDRNLFEIHGLRYDVTVIRPGTIAREYVKTYGHYHPAPFPGAPTYPEVYEVLSGRGCFLLQRQDAAGRVTDAYVVEAEPGQKVIIPPDYGHVTVNPAPDWLVMANLVATGWDSTYEPYRRLRGGAYYALEGPDGPRFLPNPRYGEVPPLRAGPAGGLEKIGIRDDMPLYFAFRLDPQAFEFLVRPEELPRGVWERVMDG